MDKSSAQSIKLRLVYSQVIGLITGVALSILVTLVFDVQLRNHTAMIIAAISMILLCWILTKREFNFLRNRYNSFVVGEAMLHSIAGIVTGVGFGFGTLYSSPFTGHYIGLLGSGVIITIIGMMSMTFIWLRPINKTHCIHTNI